MWYLEEGGGCKIVRNSVYRYCDVSVYGWSSTNAEDKEDLRLIIECFCRFCPKKELKLNAAKRNWTKRVRLWCVVVRME